MQQLNRAVATDDYENMMSALQVIAKRSNIPTFACDASFYLKLFKKRLVEKESDESELWLDDIENIARIAKSEIEQINEGMYIYM